MGIKKNSSMNMVEKSIKINDIDMNYVAFGNGKENLIIVPGLSDSLTPISQMGMTLYKQLKEFTSTFRIYVFARRKNLPPDFTTRNMADDLYPVLESLSLDNYSMLGLSQGGMIAQCFAINDPHSLKKLIIAVSLSKPNNTSKQVFERWHTLSVQGAYKKLIVDTVKKTCPSGSCKYFKYLVAFLKTLGKSKSLKGFIIQTEACMNHNSHEELHRIKTPTMIIGGMKDVIVGPRAAAEIAANIPNSILKEYENLGHDPLNHNDVIKDIYHFLIS